MDDSKIAELYKIYSLNTKASIIYKPVNWFSAKINWLASAWWENELHIKVSKKICDFYVIFEVLENGATILWP